MKASTKHLLHFLNAGHQNINLIGGIIDCKGCAHGTRDIESLHQRLCGMVAGTNCHTHLLEKHTHIERMDGID